MVFLVDLFGGSLLYPSLLGLLENVVGLVAGPYIGRYLDRTNRLEAVRRLMIGQNLSVSVVRFLCLCVSLSVCVHAAVTLLKM